MLSAAKKLKVDETNATEMSLPPIRLQALRITHEQAALLCACGRPLVRAVLRVRPLPDVRVGCTAAASTH